MGDVVNREMLSNRQHLPREMSAIRQHLPIDNISHNIYTIKTRLKYVYMCAYIYICLYVQN